MSEVLKWLEEESDRLTEESLSNADPHKTVNNSFLEGFNYALANVQGLDQPQLNENQQMMSEAGLIGVIYSQLLEEFGFGYIEKDLWMIAENLSEKIANDQPQLNENQQIAINNAKKSFEKGADIYDCAIDMMLYDGLTDKEWAKATVAFLLWAQEQEEE